MNKILLIGNLTADPEQIATKNDTFMCRFNIAVNRTFTRGNDEKTVDYFRIVVFNKSAENCMKYIGKGSKVGITGRVQFSDYVDKDGNRRQSCDVIAEDVEFLNSRKGDSAQENSPAEPSKPKVVKTDDDLPF